MQPAVCKDKYIDPNICMQFELIVRVVICID